MAAGAGRYDRVQTATTAVPDGAGGSRDIRYLRRRTPADPASIVPLAVHLVRADDRLDLVTARYLGDPAVFWRVADANNALDPDALAGQQAEGTTLVIPVPGV
jgi:hypothetical protein